MATGQSPAFRGALALTARAALVLAVLFFVPALGLIESFESPKVLLLRALGLGALVAVFVYGRIRSAVRWNAVDLAMLFWLATEIVTTALSVSPRISTLGSPYQHEGLITSIGIAGIYLALRLSHRSARAFRATLDVLLGAAALACLYAVIQTAQIDPTQWVRTAGYGAEFTRPFGTLGHPNLLGVVSAAACTLALALALHGRRRGIYGIVFLLSAVATVLTFSRAAWLGVLIGGALAGALMWNEARQLKLSPRVLAVGGLGFAALVAGLGVSSWGRLLAARAGEFVSGSSGSGASRLEIWRAALAAWRARPVLGQGPDTFEMIFPQFQTPAYWRVEWMGVPFHSHSIVLQTLSTRGALGLLAEVLVAATLAWAWWRAGAERAEGRELRAPFGGGLVAVVVSGMFGAIGICGALIIVLAAAFFAAAAEPMPQRAAGAGKPGKERASSRPGRPERKSRAGLDGRALLAGTAGLAVAALACGAGFVELKASYFARGAQVLVKSAPAQAVEAARVAVGTMPWEDLYERLRVEALLTVASGAPGSAALLDEAERAARRSIALTPQRAKCHLWLAAVYSERAERGDTSAVAPLEAAYRDVLRLAPVDIMARLLYARSELRLGRAREALAIANETVRIDSTWAPPYVAAARARIGLGDSRGARAALERALAADWKGSDAERSEAGELLRSLEPASH